MYVGVNGAEAVRPKTRLLPRRPVRALCSRSSSLNVPPTGTRLSPFRLFGVGAAGSTHGAFQKAVDRGNVPIALSLARKLGRLSLAGALSVTKMLARERDERFDAAAVRFLGRLIEELRPTLALPDASATLVLRGLVTAHQHVV